jgi:uncharacterized protein (DUF1697 family)
MVNDMVVVALLRGVNVGGHHKIGMAELRALCASLGLEGARTHLQSGNVVFRSRERDLARLSRRLEDAIEREAGFRPSVILRTCREMREAVADNPFAARPGLDPSRLAVMFLASDPGQAIRDAVLKIPAEPEEIRFAGREMYIYFPNGMARPKLKLPLVERTLKTPTTGRNWNTARRLLKMAEEMEACGADQPAMRRKMSQ